MGLEQVEETEDLYKPKDASSEEVESDIEDLISEVRNKSMELIN